MARLEVLLSADQIASRIRELGQLLSQDYRQHSDPTEPQSSPSHSQRPLVVGVLKGCFLFLADLVRALDFDPEIDFLRVASYAGAESTGVVAIRKDLEVPITGRDVLLVEDIIDTGLTLNYLRKHLLASNPRSVKICTLLDKPSRRKVDLQADYTGFTIDDVFVVGYGLDFDEHYRSLINICILHPDD